MNAPNKRMKNLKWQIIGIVDRAIQIICYLCLLIRLLSVYPMTIRSITYFTHSVISNRGCRAFIWYFINFCLWFHPILHSTEYVFGWEIAGRQCLWINSANTEQHISLETPHCTKSFPIGERSLTCPIEAFISDNEASYINNDVRY